MAHTDDDEVMRLHHTIADLQQKNMALCAMLRDAIQLADMAIKLSNGVPRGRSFPGKSYSRKGHAGGHAAKLTQM